MGLRFELAPLPAHWVFFTSVLFGGIAVLFFDNTSSTPEFGVAAAGSVLVGLWIGLSHRKRAAFLREVLKDVAPQYHRQVYNAPNFGPIPTDPAALWAAARLAAPNLGEQRSTGMAVVGVLVVLGRIPDALNHNLDLQDFALAVCLAATAVYGWIHPVRLDARAQLVTQAAAHLPIINNDDSTSTQPLPRIM
ncbi:hypothetical protein [Mycobacteroides abscessus]|uniref:hypothetical protein n=1 Tax=Mycobacteroides abscessus TaxID=36809 RepID=UPI00092CA579|nr:hypothetical protein [Mycobacteroides abscessus]SHR74898.1 Uncharacterised protein [Mycobacteroides abscessus subsp. bolletii]SHT27732.1 Uncharacterised protein [Mycobacteroides abscessus subsp. bolletii]SHT59721.1 Uncharacterised protein [Mycobacteroides abscessus subsp. bolletii]SKH15283.1 Uncharacterised protein [Mycobacteroides abscessus subsp. bolletii]SKH26424.1 Uncharacterised protein [Mycobacteroides abscessus subsp. bolletii]